MLVISVMTLSAEFLITLLERRLLSWRPPAPSEVMAI
jgi:NitT/TauT family transport system permease protein